MQKRIVFKRIFDIFISLVLLFLIYFLSVLLYFNSKYKPTDVYGYSMQPTLNQGISSPTIAGDKVFVNIKSTYGRGDLIMATVPWETRGSIVKRIVGVEGDLIQIKENVLTYSLLVNGQEVAVYEKSDSSPHYPDIAGTNYYYQQYLEFLDNPNFQNNVITINYQKYIIVNANEYFVMGDNWGETTDSITQGVIKAGQVNGRIDYIIPYTKNKTWETFKIIISCPFIKF